MRFTFAVSFLFLFCGSASAWEAKKVDGRILINKVKCDEARQLYKEMSTWRSETYQQSCKAVIVKNLARKCSLDITECVPEHVLKYQDVNPEESGPNCWNLALVMKGILPSMRYSNDEEMAYYMKPPLCSELSDDEMRKPGDVGAIRKMVNGEIVESHGFIYISENISYSKNGYNKKSPYALQPLKNVFESYKVDNELQCRQNKINAESGCKVMTSYFRCQSMKDYLDQHPDVSKDLISTLNEIEKIEACVQARVIDGQPLPPMAQQNVIDVTSGLSVYLEQQITALNENKKSSEEDIFLIGALQLRMQGLYEQLDDLESPEFANQFSVLSDIMKSSLADLKGKNK